jgi:hypothetical protein
MSSTDPTRHLWAFGTEVGGVIETSLTQSQLFRWKTRMVLVLTSDSCRASGSLRH